MEKEYENTIAKIVVRTLSNLYRDNVLCDDIVLTTDEFLELQKSEIIDYFYSDRHKMEYLDRMLIAYQKVKEDYYGKQRT